MATPTTVSADSAQNAWMSWSSVQHIQRLNGPSILNLNPFRVLCLPLDCTSEQIRSHYKRLSTIVHPDKNPGPIQELAKVAFEAVNQAYKTLTDPEELDYCRQIAEAAKKQAGPTAGPEELERAVTRLFAEAKHREKTAEEKIASFRLYEEQKERERKEQLELERQLEREWEKGREERVSDWRNFLKAKTKPKRKREGESTTEPKKKKPKVATTLSGIRPPKLVVEQRPASAPPPPPIAIAPEKKYSLPDPVLNANRRT